MKKERMKGKIKNKMDKEGKDERKNQEKKDKKGKDERKKRKKG